ncbi:hypothetical protein BD770DRAFT_442468 [Pilaira anomala]|nr:hypothetical protein BD770DRAFT_442468 [Pilaira anomala]
MVSITILKVLCISTLAIKCVYGAGQCYSTDEWSSRFGGSVYINGKCYPEAIKNDYRVCDVSGNGKRLICRAHSKNPSRVFYVWESDRGKCTKKDDGQLCSA